MPVDADDLRDDIIAELNFDFGALGGDYDTNRLLAIEDLAAPIAAHVNAALGTPGVTFADEETPAGTMDGVNAVFTLADDPAPASSLQLFRNGVLALRGTDYTLTSGNTITYTGLPPPAASEVHLAFYRF